MRTIIILLATSIALSSGAAFASKTTKTDDKQSSATTALSAAPASDHKYCVDQDPADTTGTRIYSHECRTKAEWAKRGVDIDALQKQQ